jgi:hypothetical protein
LFPSITLPASDSFPKTSALISLIVDVNQKKKKTNFSSRAQSGKSHHKKCIAPKTESQVQRPVDVLGKSLHKS